MGSTAMACEITSQQLQTEALALLQKEYPSKSFQLGKTVDVIVMGEVELGLQNIHSKFCLAKPLPDSKTRQREMHTYFMAMMKLVKEQETKIPQKWAEAKENVYLQFMPSDYLKSLNGAHMPITRKFVTGVELAVVLDIKNAYEYVRQEDAARWSVNEKVLFEIGLKNLDAKKGNVNLQGGNGADKFLAIEKKDGYDAARILIPWVRQEAAKFLGNPFLATVPNRDFLVMWSTKNSAKFHTFAKEKAKEDFKAQPYPLTSAVLRVWADGRIEPVQ